MVMLGEILVQDGICSWEQIQEALQNQVILGGRLGTNLMELGYLQEETLANYLGRQHGVSCGHGEGLRPDASSLKLLDVRVVSRLNIIPHSASNKRLVVMCMDPNNLPVLDEVAFITRMSVQPVVVPEARFWWLLHSCYGINRGLRCLALDGVALAQQRHVATVPAVPAAQAPEEELMSEQDFVSTYHRLHGDTPAAPPPQQPLQPQPLHPPHLQQPVMLAAAASWSMDAPTPSLTPCGFFAAVVPQGTPASWDGAMDGPALAEEDLPVLTGTVLLPPPPAELPPPPPDLELPPPVDESPLGFAEASALLQQAVSRDEVVRYVLRYAHSIFARAMLFTVHKDWLAGWDAVGEDIDRSRFRDLIIPLAPPSVFKLVVSSRAHFLGALQKTAMNIQLLRILGKKVPLSAIALPVLVRGKVVNVFYGDNGHRKHCTNDIGELLILALKIAQSYEAMFKAKLGNAPAAR